MWNRVFVGTYANISSRANGRIHSDLRIEGIKTGETNLVIFHSSLKYRYSSFLHRTRSSLLNTLTTNVKVYVDTSTGMFARMTQS